MSDRPANGQGKIRVAVIFGGRSTEHGVSALSASSVLTALAGSDEIEVVPVGITRRGQWMLTTGDPKELAQSGRKMPEVSTGTEVVLPADATTRGLVALRPQEGVAALSDVDVVFPVLHGAYGEDGTIQGLLEMADIPYVGAGVLASAVAMDKEYAKKLLAAEGMVSGPYAVLRPHEKTLSESERDRLGLPAFVKPARGGSSIGISRIADWSELETAIATARAVDPKVLVEAAIIGREIECGVLEGEDGGPPEASLPSEIRVVGSRQGWYDFDTKYLDDATEFDIPPNLPADVIAEIRETSCRAFTALDGAGLARVDFFLTPEGELIVNEVNTLPGFTPISQFPKMWQATGLTYPALVTRLVRTALRRGTGLR